MLFDLHCDTAHELYKSKQSLKSNSHAVSIDKYGVFDKKAQVFAIWSDKELSDDECYLSFQRIATDFKNQIEDNAQDICLCTTAKELEEAVSEGKLSAILAAEDARLLGGDISRLYRLYEYGVRILTLAWQGKSCIGGAYDTDEGLSSFGFEVLSECERLGIIVDVSHLSEKAFWDVAGKATKPFIASHSCCKGLCDHARNLTDIQIRTTQASGGIVGINLVKDHLSLSLSELQNADHDAVLDTVISHIKHLYEIAPTGTCLGLDLDGTRPLYPLESVDKIKLLYDGLLERDFDEDEARDIFFDNAYNFFLNNLPQQQNSCEE